MSFTIEIKLGRTDLLVQENTSCTLTLTNTTNSRVEALHPLPNPSQLTFRVTHIKTGVDTFFRPEPREFDDPQKIAFEARQADRVVVSLLSKIKLPAPGEYEIAAIWIWGAGAPAESNAIRVKVSAFTPRNLVLYHADYPVFTAATLNAATDPPTLLRAAIRLVPGGGFERLDSLGAVNLRTAAVLSDGPNQTVLPGDWAAWLEGDQLHALHFDPDLGATKPRKAGLPSAAFRIVPPLFSGVPGDEGGHPTGAALLLGIDPRGGASLHTVALAPDEAPKLFVSTALPGPAPGWVESRATSEGVRFVVYARDEDGRVTLNIRAWPDKPEGAHATPKRLAEWPAARLVGGSLIIDPDDVFRGVVVFWDTSAAKPVLTIVNWLAMPGGKYEELTRRTIEHDSDSGITTSVIRLFQSGFFAVLLRSEGRRWTLWDPIRGLSKLPPPLDITPLPLELAHIKSDQPIVVAGTIETGVQFLRPDGSVLKFTPK